MDIEWGDGRGKGVKGLGYKVEFLERLFGEKEVKGYLKGLKGLQERVGDYNEVFVGEEVLRGYVKEEGKGWFVVGWIRGEEEGLWREGGEGLEEFGENRKRLW